MSPHLRKAAYVSAIFLPYKIPIPVGHTFYDRRRQENQHPVPAHQAACAALPARHPAIQEYAAHVLSQLLP